MSDTLEYSYRVKAWKLLLMMVVCDAAAFGLAYIAFFNEAGIRFYRLVTLSPDGATILLWVIAAVCAAAGSLFAFMLVSGVTKKTFHIRLTPAEFTAPVGFMGKSTRTVPVSEIRNVRLMSINGQHILEVLTPDGKKGAAAALGELFDPPPRDDESRLVAARRGERRQPVARGGSPRPDFL